MIDYKLVHGKGDHEKGTACVVSLAVLTDRLANGLPIDVTLDDAECICPTMRSAFVTVNDAAWWRDDDERTAALTPFAALLVGSNCGAEVSDKRMYMLANYAIKGVLSELCKRNDAKHTDSVMLAVPEIDTNTDIKLIQHLLRGVSYCPSFKIQDCYTFIRHMLTHVSNGDYSFRARAAEYAIEAACVAAGDCSTRRKKSIGIRNNTLDFLHKCLEVRA